MTDVVWSFYQFLLFDDPLRNTGTCPCLLFCPCCGLHRQAVQALLLMQCTIWCTEIPPDTGEIKYATDLPGKITIFLICALKGGREGHNKKKIIKQQLEIQLLKEVWNEETLDAKPDKTPSYILTTLNEEFRYMKLRQVVTVPTEITLQLLLHKYAI